MLGKNVDFHAKVKSLNSGPITYTHCIIYRKALAAKKISTKLCVVFQAGMWKRSFFCGS